MPTADRKRPKRRASSSIARLPEDIRERLHAWLRDPGTTQTEARRRANALIAAADPESPLLSRSAVSRFDVRMREMTRRMQESREVAEMWIARLGSQPGGRVGHLVVEMLRTLAFEATQQLAEREMDAESLPDTLEALNRLALTASRLERSSAESERRERLIRDEEWRRAADKAAEAAGQAARSQGLSRETADEIRREILGIAA